MLGIAGNSSLAEHPVVIGGFSANAFLKGHFYSARRVVPGIDYFRFEDRAVSDDQSGGCAFDDEILAEVRSRRLEHADRLRAFRGTGINEWMSCWPMSQDHEIVNLWSNRRLFASLEAFMCPTILEIAVSIPAEWVMNRRLFQLMAGPHLRQTGWFPHGNGHFPALPWYANVFMRPMVRVGRRLLRLGRREQNPYAWPSVDYCVSLPLFRELVNQLATTVCTKDPMIRRAVRIAERDSAPAMQRFAAAQFLASFRELGEIRSSELISRQTISQLS